MLFLKDFSQVHNFTVDVKLVYLLQFLALQRKHKPTDSLFLCERIKVNGLRFVHCMAVSCVRVHLPNIFKFLTLMFKLCFSLANFNIVVYFGVAFFMRDFVFMVACV